jgi:hypothetical protein
MNSLYRGPSIDASYQVSDQLALWFHRRRLKCEKLANDRLQMTDDGRQVIAKAHMTQIASRAKSEADRY